MLSILLPVGRAPHTCWLGSRLGSPAAGSRPAAAGRGTADRERFCVHRGQACCFLPVLVICVVRSGALTLQAEARGAGGRRVPSPHQRPGGAAGESCPGACGTPAARCHTFSLQDVCMREEWFPLGIPKGAGRVGRVMSTQDVAPKPEGPPPPYPGDKWEACGWRRGVARCLTPKTTLQSGQGVTGRQACGAGRAGACDLVAEGPGGISSAQ